MHSLSFTASLASLPQLAQTSAMADTPTRLLLAASSAIALSLDRASQSSQPDWGGFVFTPSLSSQSFFTVFTCFVVGVVGLCQCSTVPPLARVSSG